MNTLGGMLTADQDKYNALNESTMSMESQAQSDIVHVDMFGNNTQKKDSVKGQKYLFFTVLMIILLSTMVILETKNVREIA